MKRATLLVVFTAVVFMAYSHAIAQATNSSIKPVGDKGYIGFYEQTDYGKNSFSLWPKPENTGTPQLYGLIDTATKIRFLNLNNTIKGDRLEILKLLNNHQCVAFGKIKTIGTGEAQKIVWIELNIFLID